MRGKKRLSPFEKLLRVVEGLLFDHALELQVEPMRSGVNPDFSMGYTVALNEILTHALAIYNGGMPVGVMFLDMSSTEYYEKIKALYKEG